jgi:hypothetical protein
MLRPRHDNHFTRTQRPNRRAALSVPAGWNVQIWKSFRMLAFDLSREELIAETLLALTNNVSECEYNRLLKEIGDLTSPYGILDLFKELGDVGRAAADDFVIHVANCPRHRFADRRS